MEGSPKYVEAQKTPEEIAREDLEFVASSLRGWFNNRENDSVRIQTARALSFRGAADDLSRLHERLKSTNFRIQFSVGESAVSAASFSRGPYDIPQKSYRTLESGSSVILKAISERGREDTLEYQAPYDTELYVGEIGRLIPLAGLARALSEGAILELVEVEDQAQTS